MIRVGAKLCRDTGSPGTTFPTPVLGCPGWLLKCSGLNWSLDMAANYVRKSGRVIDHHGARVHMHPTAVKRFT